MSKTALGMRHSAFGQSRRVASTRLARVLGKLLSEIFAECRVPNAECHRRSSNVATCCTVTFPLTSVTQLGLAESVLIGVGKLYLACLLGLSPPWILGFEALRCSFGGETCIQ